MDIQQTKHDLNGGFSSVLMAMKLLKPELGDPELVSLLDLSVKKIEELSILSAELVDYISSKQEK